MRWQVVAKHSAQLSLTLQRQGRLRICPQPQRLHINRSIQCYSKLPHRQQLWESTRSSRLLQNSRPLYSKAAEVAAGKSADKQPQEQASQDVWPFSKFSLSLSSAQRLSETQSRISMAVQSQEGWPITPVQLRVTAHHWQTRTAAYARNSFLAAYSTFIDNTLVAVLQWLRLDELFTRLTPWLEDSLALLTRNAPHKSNIKDQN